MLAIVSLIVGCTAQRAASPPAGQPSVQFLSTGTRTVKTPGHLLAPAAFVDNMLPEPGRKIIVAVDLTVEVDTARIAADSIAAIAVNRGGFVVSGQNQKVAIRVPTERLEETIGQIMSLGHLIDRKYAGTDITDSYRDNQVRMENAIKVRERLLQLLDKAESIQDILQIERELERINREIDSLNGQLKAAAQRLEFTAVTVHLRSTYREKPGPVGFVFFQIYKGCRWLIVH